MTAATTSTAPPAAAGTRVGLGRVTRAAWRQHRSALGGLTLAALALAGGALWIGSGGAVLVSDGMLYTLVADFYALSVGTFLAAPLLAREYEHRTHLWAWSQDVSPTRWLTGQALLIIPIIVVHAVILGAGLRFLAARIPNAPSFEVPLFDASGWEQAATVVFAFALGLALSALTRRTGTATTATFAAFLAVRMYVAFGLRPRYLTPVRAAVPLGVPLDISPGDFSVGSGYLTATGQVIPDPSPCLHLTGSPQTECIRQHGAVRTFVDYQPAGRLLDFHLIEAGLFVALTVVLLVVTVALVRRSAQT